MKHELIKTDNYLLVVSDKEITEQTGNDTIFNKNLNKITAGVYDDDDNQFKVLAHLPLNEAPYLEGVDVLPPLDESVEDMMRSIVSNDDASKEGFITGWHLCKQTYKYTEDDLRKAIFMAQEWKSIVKSKGEQWIDYKYHFQEITQSLDQPKLPIAFDSHTQRFADKNNILKQWDGPRTTTNSEGRTEWVGKYLFK